MAKKSNQAAIRTAVAAGVVQQVRGSSKIPNKYLLATLIILSIALLASYGPRTTFMSDQPKALAVQFDKVYDLKSSINIDKNVTEKELQDFYSFAVDEYGNANYGSAKDLLLGITQKTDKQPMAWYYLAQIYRDVYPYSLQRDKLKIALLNIVKSDLNVGMKQSAYDDLAKIETNVDSAIAYGKKAVELEDNMFSRYILLTVYYNAYEKTHNKLYRTEFSKVYDSRMRNIFADSTVTPWMDGALALK